MGIRVHHHRFLTTGLGALGALAGMVLKNSNSPLQSLGRILCVLAFLLVSYSISMDNKGDFSPSLKALVVFSAVIGILYSGYNIKSLEGAPDVIIRPFIILYVVSWLLLGVSIGLGRNNSAFMIGILGAVAIILSTVFALPWQRLNGIVDGPGPYLLSLGWLLITFANSVY